MKRIFLIGSAALLLAPAPAKAMPREGGPNALSPSAAASPSPAPSPVSAPSGPTAPAQPSGPVASAPAQPLAPTVPSPLSPSAAAAASSGPQLVSGPAVDSDLPEEVGQDLSPTTQTVPADLGKLDSATLARLARSLGVDAPTVWFDPDQQQPMTTASDNAQSVDAMALYAALQQRSDAGDKDARQALAMARLRGDPRAELAPAGTSAAAADSATVQALGLSPSSAATLGLQALSAAAQALGLSPSAGATPAP